MQLENDNSLGQSEFKRAIELIGHSTKTHRQLVPLLKSTNPDLETFLNLNLSPYLKRIAAFYIGSKDGKNKNKFFSIAKKMNFDLSPPYHSINQFVR